MKVITLRDGPIALVDDEDYSYLSQFKWRTTRSGKNLYAMRQKMKNKKIESILMHRDILRLHKGDGQIVDHINQYGLDNRKKNLRLVTKSENNMNSKENRSNTSGYRGVCWDRNNGKWITFLGYKGKNIHLGRFTDVIEAARAWDEAAYRLYGELAVLNFPRKLQ